MIGERAIWLHTPKQGTHGFAVEIPVQVLRHGERVSKIAFVNPLTKAEVRRHVPTAQLRALKPDEQAG